MDNRQTAFFYKYYEGKSNKYLTIDIYSYIKRLFDLLIAIPLFLFTFPLVGIILIVVYIQTGLSPIYIQKRGLSLSKYQFKIFKIRTMYKTEIKHVDSNVFIQHEYNDLIIPIGRFLRKTGLDELPQLVNVIFGDMSLIGPRPLSNTDLEIIKRSNSELYYKRENLNEKPGISGYWQIYGNRKEGIKNMVELEEFYKQNKSVALDVSLFIMTVPLICFARHSDSITNSYN